MRRPAGKGTESTVSEGLMDAVDTADTQGASDVHAENHRSRFGDGVPGSPLTVAAERRAELAAAAPLRLMAVHAHPDDESSKGAASLAKYAHDGVGVMVVSCTGGERGDILNPKLLDTELDIPTLRITEMARAAEILGVAHSWLGFEDSGYHEGAPETWTLPEGSFGALDVDVERVGVAQLGSGDVHAPPRADEGADVAPIQRDVRALVHAERELLAVHVSDEVRYAGVGLHRRIGEVAPQAHLIRERLVVRFRLRRQRDRRDGERDRAEC